MGEWLAGARGGAPLSGFGLRLLEGRCGEGASLLRWVAEGMFTTGGREETPPLINQGRGCQYDKLQGATTVIARPEWL
jgi:hypothetical protein